MIGVQCTCTYVHAEAVEIVFRSYLDMLSKDWEKQHFNNKKKN